ncbi:hypothetical protein DSO57_1009141 [Entomophthora muscae]|uniref:Uncharacterized protein n=1 Tax=Entomophthora muscae TaxID=34485 RepID=A0ACC2SJS2_9FUNG|nr:hypothetical protein DSO57_1009141 [Entomophthora muscae]
MSAPTPSKSEGASRKRKEMSSDGELASNLKDYLKMQSGSTFKKLFKSPATCLALHRYECWYTFM